MEGESPNPARTPAGAAFLSYASQDAEAAQRICEALRAAGIEVWFDQSALRGGDAWDREIHERLHDCRLFIAVISANTESRDEGYFRREWRLAVDRTHDMSDKRAFLVPVVVDDTQQRGASVPDKFHEVQWTRLPAGKTPPAFVERVRRLVSPEPSHGQTTAVLPASAAAPPTRERVPPSWRSRRTLVAIIALVVTGALAYFAIDKFWLSKHPISQSAAPASPAPTSFAPPPHSIAVLPFVNLSGDKEQEYFSDGLTEELLNSLAKIDELQVAARTSSFSFREHPDVASVAHKLNVATVLEGSVRRSAKTVRVTAQLINTVTGFHLWSKTYDRDLGDVLKLQTEIATAVASALEITLLGDVGAKIELGGTGNPAAFDAYLRGAKARGENLLSAISAYTEAIRLDPGYALAFVARSWTFNDYAANWATGAEVQEGLRKAGADARRALALAPDLAEAHLALAYFYESILDMPRADDEFSRARQLAPGSSLFLQRYGLFAIRMGRTDTGLATLRQAIRLDPVTAGPHGTYGYVLYLARRYEEAVTAYNRASNFEPDNREIHAARGLAYYALGKVESARSDCASDSEDVDTLVCLAVTYAKLGQPVDAKSTLAKFMKLRGDADTYAYSEIYAQWGDTSKALEWLEKAVRLRDTGLILLKTDPLMDPLRKEPRFQTVMRELKFPD